MADHYQQLERWIEQQLDMGFIHNGNRFSWDTLNEEVDKNRERPDQAKGLVRQTLLNLYDREKEKVVAQGIDISNLNGLYEYADRRLTPGSKRDNSIRRLTENKLKWKNNEGKELRGMDIFEEMSIDKKALKKAVQQEVEEKKEKETEFIRIQKQIQTATPDQLKSIKGQITKAPFTKEEKDFLRRLISIEKTESPEYRQYIEDITRGIASASAPESLKDEERKIKNVSDEILRLDLERNLAKKKLELGGIVQRGTKEKLFGDFDSKLKRVMESYNSNEEFVSHLTKQQLRTYGFSEDEILLLKEYRGKVPKITLAERLPPTLQKPAEGTTVKPRKKREPYVPPTFEEITAGEEEEL